LHFNNNSTGEALVGQVTSQPFIMTNDKTAQILTRLESGFRSGSKGRSEADQEFARTLQEVRSFGRKHASPVGWNSTWQRHWDIIQVFLAEIAMLVDEMDRALERTDSSPGQSAVDAWDKFQLEYIKMIGSMGCVQAQAALLDAPSRREWNGMARKVEARVEAMHARAEVLRIKAELMGTRSKSEVNLLLQGIAAKLPLRAQKDGTMRAVNEPEYSRAAIELEKEQHQFLGFTDTVKALFMWVETPEERVHGTSVLTVDESGAHGRAR
jgi:hypothetical protein